VKRLLLGIQCLLLCAASWGEEDPLPAEAKILTSNSLASEYSEQLTATDRLAGLSLLWSEARYNFANFDLVANLDWDAHYHAAIPRVLSAETTAEYYQELRRFYAALKDGHSGVTIPPELHRRLFAKPPVSTRLVEKRVIIDGVNSKKLVATGLNVGLEILAINGIDVHEYAAREIKPYQSASTSQDLDVRVYRYGLLQGDEEQEIDLLVSDTSGRQQTLSVPRTGYGADD
jgi:carboxyl-terminal processing protease